MTSRINLKTPHSWTEGGRRSPVRRGEREEEEEEEEEVGTRVVGIRQRGDSSVFLLCYRPSPIAWPFVLIFRLAVVYETGLSELLWCAAPIGIPLFI